MRRRDSIPRKQVGSSTHTPSASVTSTSPHVPGSFAEDVDLEAPPVPQHDRPLSQQPEYQQYNTSPEQVYGHKPLPEHGRYQERALETRNHHGASQQPPSQITPSRGARHQQPWEDANESTYSPSTEHRVQPREFPGRGPKDQRGDDYIAPLAVRSKRASTDYAAQPSGNDVVERTNSNTYDTEVIEKVAPGKPLLTAALEVELTRFLQLLYMKKSKKRSIMSGKRSSRARSTPTTSFIVFYQSSM